jgi:aryl-alcohol dehydrogenase-like predicted oxidoreductase
MQTVALGAPGLPASRLTYGTRRFGGDRWTSARREHCAPSPPTAVHRSPNWRRPGCWPPAVQVAARTPAHPTQNLGALGLSLSRSDLTEIDHVTTAAVPFGGPTLEGTA